MAPRVANSVRGGRDSRKCQSPYKTLLRGLKPFSIQQNQETYATHTIQQLFTVVECDALNSNIYNILQIKTHTMVIPGPHVVMISLMVAIDFSFIIGLDFLHHLKGTSWLVGFKREAIEYT